MKEFMKTDKVTYNLMSFTAFKALLLFSYLLEAPRSYEEIRSYFAKNKYLNETISIDTLRVYINSLERMGCEIRRSKKSEGSKYHLLKHPFEIFFSDKQIESILKVFKTLSKDIEAEELIVLTEFLKKISEHVENESLKKTLENISPLTKLNNEILNALINACNNKDEIVITYNSPNSGIKNIEVLAERIHVKNNKTYLYGKSKQYENGAEFMVSRITKIPAIKLEHTIFEKDSPYIVTYELLDETIPLNENEVIKSKKANSIIVELNAKNEFFAKQRILSLGSNCKIITPENLKKAVIQELQKMKEEYVR